MQVMQAMVEVGAETNLVTGLLTAGALTNSPSILALLEDRFTASARRAEKQLAKLPAGTKFEPLKERVRALVQALRLQGARRRERDGAPHQGVPRARAAHQPADRPDRRPQLRRRDAERGGGEALEQAGEGAGREPDHGPAQRAGDRGAKPPAHQPDQRGRGRQGQRVAGAAAGSFQGSLRPAGEGVREDRRQGPETDHRRHARLRPGRRERVRAARRRDRRHGARRQDDRRERHHPALARPRGRGAGRRGREVDAERLGQAGGGPRPQPHAADDRRGGELARRRRHRRVLRAAPAGAPADLDRRRDAPPLLGRDRPRRCRPRPTATRSARWRARSKCSARARSTAARWRRASRASRPRNARAAPQSSG